MTAIGREPANARAGGGQQAQFRPRQIAGSDQEHGTGLQIEKHRQKSHTMLASPTYGVDWNYFLYMSHSTSAKRKLFLLYCVATIEFSPSKAKGQRCIFPLPIKPWTSCVARLQPMGFRLRNSRQMAVPRCPRQVPPWIIWTPSRPRASTSSGKPSPG